jgi:hypothetical protein
VNGGSGHEQTRGMETRGIFQAFFGRTAKWRVSDVSLENAKGGGGFAATNPRRFPPPRGSRVP